MNIHFVSFQKRNKMSKINKICVIGILWTTLLLFFPLVSSEQSSRNIRLRYRRNSNDEIGKIALPQRFQTPGVNFTNFLQAAFTREGPQNAKKTVKSSSCFALSGSVCIKDARRMLIKLTPGVLGPNLIKILGAY